MDIDPKFVELMHAEIDGMNSERESSELQAFLEGNPGARETFAGLRRLAETLAAVASVEPPVGLRDRIVHALPTESTSGSAGLIRRLRAAWPDRRVAVRYAYAMAAGVVIGLAGYHWAINSPGTPQTDSNNVVGTLVPHELILDSTVLRQLEINEADINGTVRVGRSEGGVSIEFDVAAPVPAEAVLAYDPAALAVSGLTRSLDAVRALEVGEDEIRWTLHGHHQLAVFFDKLQVAETTLELQLFVSGDLVYSGPLNVPSSKP